MRRAAKPDANRASIVAAFRSMGCSWLDIVPIEGGEPDGLLGCAAQDKLVEIKPEGKKLRRNQIDWAAGWRGRKPCVVRTLDDVETLVAYMQGNWRRKA